MKTLIASRPRSEEHCGAVHNLRIRGDLPQATAACGSVSRAGRSPSGSRKRLHIGDVAASLIPVVLDTLLGSCVAVCMYDPILLAGGMNHILLPKCSGRDKTARCGVHAMELLINELMKLGGDRKRFIAKAFGGANVLKGITTLPIGEANARFVREFLATEHIPLVAERLGGNHAVHLYFHTDTGKATVHTVDGSNLPKIIDAEGSYSKLPCPDKPYYGEITLF